MRDAGPSLDEFRRRLIELIEDEEWRITERAERTGREFSRRFLPVPTQLSIVRHILQPALCRSVSWPSRRPTRLSFVRHILQLLKQDDCSLIPAPMSEPPGSRGLGYRLRDPVSPNRYIKVKIEEDLAWILSFQESKPSERPRMPESMAKDRGRRCPDCGRRLGHRDEDLSDLEALSVHPATEAPDIEPEDRPRPRERPRRRIVLPKDRGHHGL